MNINKFLRFIKLNIFIVPLFLVVSYFIVPIFSVSSPCYDLASSPTDPTILSVPCIRLTTIPQHLYPIYITKFGFHYQGFYTYDLTAKYVSPLLNLFFAYFVSTILILSIERIGIIVKNKMKS